MCLEGESYPIFVLTKIKEISKTFLINTKQIMKKEVDIRAKFIRGLLLTYKQMSLGQIAEITKHDDVTIAMAVGWLLHDTRVIMSKDQYGSLYLEFNNPISEIYY